ncbi:MAG: flagellar motor switch protein FliN [Porcipelethomonas sp.]
MKNSTDFNETQFSGLNDIVEMGLKAASETLEKILNNEVAMSAEEMRPEKAGNIESYGNMPGVIINIQVSGTISGRISVIIKSEFIKSILNMLMNNEDSGSDELDEISLGTFRELVNQMSGAFAAAVTNFFGAEVSAEAFSVSEFSSGDDTAEIMECEPDDEMISIISKFVINNVLGGSFNIECDNDIMVSILSRITMIPESDDERMFLDAIAGGNNPMNIKNAAAFQNNGRASTIMRDNSIEVQSAQFPSFGRSQGVVGGIPLTNGNIDLLMDVPLNVTIEIGKTRKKMRDIMEFTQGTVIDLEKQAGAPVDVVVNGQLIARGDVVVIDDNFGVRITEIIGNNFLEKNSPEVKA